MSINFSPTIKINHVYQYKHPPMHYSRLSARKKQQKRESFSTHLQSSTGKKWGGGGAQLIFVSKDKVKVNQKRKFLLIFSQGPKGTLLKKPNSIMSHTPPKMYTPLFSCR